MRMWMVSPKLMCRKHLMGEYVECLMLAGTLKRKRKIGGYIQNGLLEPKSLVSRFAALKKEMLARGYRARKSLKSVQLSYLPKEQQNAKVNQNNSMRELAKRCKECRERMRTMQAWPDYLAAHSMLPISRL